MEQTVTLEDDLDDLRAESKAQRNHTWAYLAHPDPADPDHPEPICTEHEAVQADIAYNSMKNSGELQRREADRALAEQIKWESQ